MIQQCRWLEEQDQVNNANSAFILINCLITQGFQSGSIGPGAEVRFVTAVTATGSVNFFTIGVNFSKNTHFLCFYH